MKELQDEKATIEDSPRITAKQKKRLAEIEKEIIPLKQFLDDAKKQRQQIRNEIGMHTLLVLRCFILEITSYLIILDTLKNDPAKVVIVLDFTKFGMVDEGNVHCFVVTLLSSGSDESVKSGISCHSKFDLFL